MNIIQTNFKWNGKLSYGNIPKMIVLHNADASKCTIQDVHQWHLNNGWSGCGYHYFVRKDGSIYKGRPDGAIGSHCKGHNTNTLGICFEGRYEYEDNMPQTQYNAGINLIRYLFAKYGVMPIKGHKELFATACPGKYFPLEDFKKLKQIHRTTKYNIGWNSDEKGKWYSIDGTNYYKDCWKQIDGNWYSFNPQGYIRQSVWLKYQGYWYYLKENGIMARNEWLKIKGKSYYFGDKGGMYSNCCTPDGYFVTSDGSWDGKDKIHK